jgi:hypothetical protein
MISAVAQQAFDTVAPLSCMLWWFWEDKLLPFAQCHGSGELQEAAL